MGLTTYGLETAMIRLGSDIGEPAYLAVGSGSGAIVIGTTGLVAELDRNAFTTSDFSGAQKWTTTTDFSTTEMINIDLREFGVFVLSSGGKCWHREGFDAITFDGTNELQVEITWEIY